MSCASSPAMVAALIMPRSATVTGSLGRKRQRAIQKADLGGAKGLFQHLSSLSAFNGVTRRVVAWGAWGLWWQLPRRVVENHRLKVVDPKARADIQDNFPKTVRPALGGIAVLVRAGVAYLQFLQQQQAARDLLISRQFSKSVIA
jgi:hypothetical protein